MELKHVCIANEMTRQQKRWLLGWRKILSTYTLCRGLISRLKELKKSQIPGEKKQQSKNKKQTQKNPSNNPNNKWTNEITVLKRLSTDGQKIYE